MDGKGRYLDNIFVDRLWRSVKYEEVYLKAYRNGSEARRGIDAYLDFYNRERPHQSLGYRTPAQVFAAGEPLGCLPEQPSPERENQARMVALDPGVRSFLAWYCPDSVGKIAQGAYFRIQRLCERLDDLLSRSAKAPSRKRRSMRRAASRMRIRVESLIQELHRQTARFLVDNFDVILLPTFETSDMVELGRRRIRSKTVRNLLSLAHYRFGMFLRHKTHEAGVAIVSVNEAYTTKTVSWTGESIENLGGATVIVGGDGERMDRDYNGARGIYLRALGDTPALRAWLPACAASVTGLRLSGNVRVAA